MNTTKRSTTRRTVNRWGLLLACVSMSIGIFTSSNGLAAQSIQQRTFPSPEDAAKTLIDVVKKGNVDEVLMIFGQDGKDLLASSDAATARQNQQVFVVAAAEQWRLSDDGKGGKNLIIGKGDWTVREPVVKAACGWVLYC